MAVDSARDVATDAVTAAGARFAGARGARVARASAGSLAGRGGSRARGMARPGARRGGAGRRVLGPIPPRVLLVVVAILAMSAAGWMWFRDSGLVQVRDVFVVGLKSDEQNRIRKALRDAATQMTTLNVDERALRDAVERFPSVASVRAKPDFPHALTIEVVERVPVAVLVSGTTRIPVSSGGVVLTGLDADRSLAQITIRVPVNAGRLRDKWARGAVAVVGAAPTPLRRRISKVRLVNDGVLVDLRNGPDLLFGAARDLHAKWTAAARVLADEAAVGASRIDVRVPERPAAAGVAPTPEPTPSATPTPNPAAPTPTPSAYPTVSPAATPTVSP